MTEVRAIEYPKVKLIEYWDEHVYAIDPYEEDGQIKYRYELPSVSSKLQVISKGFQYEDWLKQTGVNSDFVRDRAAESGVKIHKAIQYYLTGETVKATNDQKFTWAEWKKFNQFCDWFERIGFKPLEIERIVWDTSVFCAGTLDFIGELRGEKYLLDWKTGGEYDAHSKQVAAYKSFYEKETGIKIDHVGSVYIGAMNRTWKDLNGPGVKVNLIDHEVWYKRFVRANEEWADQNPGWKPRARIYPLERKLVK